MNRLAKIITSEYLSNKLDEIIGDCELDNLIDLIEKDTKKN
jgi:hypothetical protein